MRRSVLTVTFILLAGTFAFSSGPAVQIPVVKSQQITIGKFDQEIQRIDAALADLKSNAQTAVPLHESIPDKYIVVAGKASFTIDNTVLKKSVGEYVIAYPHRKAELLSSMQSELQQMRQGLTDYVRPQQYNQERAKLQEVLSRREFHRVAGPTFFDKLKEKANAWIARILMKLFGKMPSGKAGSQIVTWVLIAIATCLLVIWIVRNIRRKEVEIVREPILFAPSGKHWRVWLNEAHSAAAKGRWRDAIHLAYWAGISNLEESGAWVPDRARTPREYLRIISPRDPNRPALSALTRKFEVIWYGDYPAASSDYQETLRQLEVMGCR